ncbi:MAG: DNA polymerase III subunit epsilon [Gammaproteobacteria bacterium]|nr:DNA polymerase III subunit epsilon [Gammaproteobacteria bacterium]
MITRQIILDTETTGLNPKDGHRIIEIGCVEMVNRKLTGNNFHYYLNPNREIDQEAIKIHGITNQFLADKPCFNHIAEDFLNYITGAELIAHNSRFDIGFLNHELALAHESLSQSLNLNKIINLNELLTITDTLELAKKLHPGQKNSLDALCRRYNIDNTHRELHGALLDAKILADVYLIMTGGQGKFEFEETEQFIQNITHSNLSGSMYRDYIYKIISPTSDELELHNKFLEKLRKTSAANLLWEEIVE